ncbi:MAG: hypothetical protein DWQ05_22245 [Calditrichaeota bacterium]|nr:MAG: hypothetical protein DWQ05_22245 [Calditrichota bacterium]
MAGFHILSLKKRYFFSKALQGILKAFCCLVLGFFLLSWIPYNNSDPNKLILGTATEGGNYYNLGISIKSICDQTKDINLEMISTQGSVDNILKLKKGELDIAIVQNDIAFLAENGLYPFNEKILDLTCIMTFYSEPVFLISNNSTINNINQLANSKVNIGPLGSGLFTDSKIILNSAKLWDLVLKTNAKPTDVLGMLQQNDIQAAFINNIPESINREIEAGSIFIIPLSASLIQSITKTYPYFTEYRTSILSNEIRTVAVKSILICKKELTLPAIYRLTKLLYNNYGKLQFPARDIAVKRENIILSMPLKSWHEGAENYYIEIGIMESQAYLLYLWLLLFTILLLVLVIFVLNIILFSSNRKSLNFISTHSRFLKFIKNINLKILRHKYLLILFIMATAYLSDIIYVQHLEHDWAIKNNAISNFDNRSFIRNLLWMFVFGGSGYSDNLFPQSPLGKFFVTLIPLIGLGGFLTILGFITSDHIKKRILEAKGMKTKLIKNHIILCGWNSNVPFLIKNLLHENILHKRKILILADLKEDMPIEKYDLDADMISYVKGQATNKDDLRKANLKDAEIAIIVADEDSSDSDAKTILKILTIEKYSSELEKGGIRNNRNNIYTIAEIQDPTNNQIAHDAQVDEIISLGDIKAKIFVESVLNPGVSKFVTEILTFNEFNDIYSIPIDQNSSLNNHTFDELLLKLRKYKILLLSISLENRRDKNAIAALQEKYHLTRAVITNPILEVEMNYRTHPGDILIVLAQYEKVIDNALEKIKKSSQ